VKYVTRETGNLLRDSVEPRPDADSDDRPWNRVREAGSRCDGGSTDGVERVASRVQTRSTRPTAGDPTSERQRLVRQEEAATRLSHSRRRYVDDVRPTNSLRHSVLNSTAMHVNGSTSARSPTTPVSSISRGTHMDVSASGRPSGNSDSHSDSQSDNFFDDYWVTLIHPLSSAS